MNRYDDSMSLAAARAAFFVAGGLGEDGGYNARWVRVESRPVPVFFPNTACRVAAAKLHDLHHVATEYDVDWPGEGEIAAWEIASGCGRYFWAWLLNLGAFTIGLFLAPRRVFRAFVRGRRAVTNLYHIGLPASQLPQLTVGALRRQIGIGGVDPEVRPQDVIRFVVWASIGLVWHIAVGVAVLVTIVIAFHTLRWL